MIGNRVRTSRALGRSLKYIVLIAKQFVFQIHEWYEYRLCHCSSSSGPHRLESTHGLICRWALHLAHSMCIHLNRLYFLCRLFSLMWLLLDFFACSLVLFSVLLPLVIELSSKAGITFVGNFQLFTLVYHRWSGLSKFRHHLGS